MARQGIAYRSLTLLNLLHDDLRPLWLRQNVAYLLHRHIQEACTEEELVSAPLLCKHLTDHIDQRFACQDLWWGDCLLLGHAAGCSS